MTISKTKFYQNDTWYNHACKYVTPCKDIRHHDTVKLHYAKKHFTRMTLRIITLAKMSHLIRTLNKMTIQNDTLQNNISANDTQYDCTRKMA